jgi:ribosomal protein S18 acetylase RimI-like enzyme
MAQPAVAAAVTDAVALRPVTPEDRGFLLKVYASTRAEEVAATGWPEDRQRAFVESQFAAQSDHYAKHYAEASFDVIVVDGQAAGRLYVHRGRSEIRIVDVALLPEWRGRGIGTGLLEALLDEGRGSDRAVTIHVELSNPAMRLYERLGFKAVEQVGPYQLMRWAADNNTEKE